MVLEETPSNLNSLAARPPAAFLHWNVPLAWAALMASRLPARVLRQEIQSAAHLQSSLKTSDPTVWMFADVADVPQRLYECVRFASERPRTLILVVQSANRPAIGEMLCEAGAHASLPTVGDLMLWLPAVRRFLLPDSK